jgi:hypothetical protein
MTGPQSLACKQKTIQRLTGPDAVSASQTARETGLRQQNSSRLLQEGGVAFLRCSSQALPAAVEPRAKGSNTGRSL